MALSSRSRLRRCASAPFVCTENLIPGGHYGSSHANRANSRTHNRTDQRRRDKHTLKYLLIGRSIHDRTGANKIWSDVVHLRGVAARFSAGDSVREPFRSTRVGDREEFPARYPFPLCKSPAAGAKRGAFFVAGTLARVSRATPRYFFIRRVWRAGNR